MMWYYISQDQKLMSYFCFRGGGRADIHWFYTSKLARKIKCFLKKKINYDFLKNHYLCFVCKTEIKALVSGYQSQTHLHSYSIWSSTGMFC